MSKKSFRPSPRLKATKLNFRRDQFRHFRGSVYILGRVRSKVLKAMMRELDRLIAEKSHESMQGINIETHNVLIDARGGMPTLAFRHPVAAQYIAEVNGESIEETMARMPGDDEPGRGWNGPLRAGWE